jgi:hypothetical protein
MATTPRMMVWPPIRPPIRRPIRRANIRGSGSFGLCRVHNLPPSALGCSEGNGLVHLFATEEDGFSHRQSGNI